MSCCVYCSTANPGIPCRNTSCPCHNKKETKSMPTADEAYLEQVKKLVSTASAALDEARTYADLIFDEGLKQEAIMIIIEEKDA